MMPLTMYSLFHRIRPTPRTHAQTLDWHICEDEREWHDVAQRRPARPPVDVGARDDSPQREWPRRLPRVYVPITLVFLMLVTIGGWWSWQRAQTGLAEVETAIAGEAIAELWRDQAQERTVTNASMRALNPLVLADDLGEAITQVQVRNIGRDWAVVEVTIQLSPGGPSYRQTRLYQEGECGWVRSNVVAARWGAKQTFESDSFIFHYRELDADAMMQAAPQLDALYPALEKSLIVQLPTGVKPTIDIDPARAPGSISPQAGQPAHFVVASPTTALVPADLSASDVLLQAVVLAHFEQLTPTTSPDFSAPGQRLQLRNGQRLWLIWAHDLPLARWREPLVRWVFAGATAQTGPGQSNVPPFARDLCAYHQVWLSSPLDVQVPIFCWQVNGVEKIAAWREFSALSTLSLNSLIYAPSASQGYSDEWFLSPEPAPNPSAIELATLFEYVSDTYGEEGLARLLATIPAHERAETLIPAVFDVPLSEFTDGWRSFLVERYQIDG